jgi:lipoprotein-anchoring transpeptidase ErfK/SrfK
LEKNKMMETKKRSILAIITGGVAMLAALFILAGMAGPTAAQGSRIALSSPVALNAKADVLGQPASDGTVVGSLPANSRGTIMGGPFNTGDWYWVDFTGGTRGYVPRSVLVVVDARYTPVPTGVAGSPTAGAPSATAVTSPTAVPTQDAALGQYTGLMLAEMNGGGNVRVAPGVENRRLKTWPKGRRVLLYEEAKDNKGDVWYRVSEPPEEPMWVHTSLISKLELVKFEAAKFRGKWINVNITQQIVTAYEGAKPVKVTLTSTGTAKDPTELGTWKIYWRLPKQDMEGGNLASDDYYSLKDVPFPQYFHTSGEGFHGTYWHDDFGKRRSHGCVNLSTPMSEWLYGWAKIGTDVWVHN